MRNTFAKEITRLAGRNKNIVMIMADIGNHLFDEYKSLYPNRFFNCGIAEANMISMAAGLASCGYRPICYTITPFVTVRCLEQIRVDVCYHDMPVTIVGTGSGLSYASLGATHHSCEDISMLRSIPNMKVICPGDVMEVSGCLESILMKNNSPAYLRIGKKNEEVVHGSIPSIKIGKNIIIKHGDGVALLSTGNTLPIAMKASVLLERDKINNEVTSCHTIKPLDEEYLKLSIKRFKIIVIIEEHSVIGGLGSSVAEWLLKNNIQSYAQIIHFAIPDKFLHVCVNQTLARQYFHITADEIYNSVVCNLPSSVNYLG